MTEGRAPPERLEPPGVAAQGEPRGDVEYGAEAPVDGSRAEPGHEAADIAASGFPWPPAAADSVVDAFVRTWQSATFRPRAFFRALPEDASLGAALLYYLPLGILIAGADLFWQLLRARSEADATLDTASGSAVDPLVWFLVSPLLLVVSLFLSAAVTHGLVKLFGDTRRDYSATVCVFAFAYSPMLFAVVPVIGSYVGYVWMLVVAIIGMRAVHGSTTGRAAAAVLIPVIFAGLLLLLLRFLRAAGTLLDMPL